MNNIIRFALVVFLSGLMINTQSAEEVTGWAAGEIPVVVQGGTLIDVRNGNLISNSNIVINGDEIESIGESSVPQDAIVVDASGKYIIPGLIDLHVHYKDWSGPLYLNHGVTTAISLGDTYDWIRAQKVGIKRGLIEGPRLFISTENVDKTPEDLSTYFVRPHVSLFNNAEDASEGMIRYLTDGVDAVKVYDGLNESQLVAIIEEAEKADIPVIGHFKDVRVAATLGAHGIEHTAAVANVLIDNEAKAIAMRKVRKGLNVPAESFMDLTRLPDLVEEMVESGLYLNPTIRMGWHSDRQLREKGFHYEDFDLTFNDWRLRFIPIGWRLANLKEYQEFGLWNWRDLTEYERDLFHQGYLNVQKLVKQYETAGGKLYAGTDSANMAVPGLSLHQEMELFVAAGVSPLTALQAATINPAELMRMSSRLGTIEEGKVGDLVILDADPLEDIRNTRKIHRVVSRGKVLDGEYDGNYKNPVPNTTPEQSSHYFPSPRIRSVTPGTLYENGGDKTLTITGTGFIPYSFARWDNVKLDTEFVSEYELKVEIPESLLRDIGTYTIAIENPDFAWGTVFARGASDIVHMGVRDNVSNEMKVIVVWR
jgi:imidazolonepropionase-like amidohydrolase